MTRVWLLIASAILVFFDGVLSMPSDGLPYPVWLYAALLPWILFSEVATAPAPAW